MDTARTFSERFRREVQISRHAQQRMAERGIDQALLLDLIETGTVKHKDATHLWLYRHYDGRDDNLLCVAAVIEQRLVVKTVMHYFEPE